jgi:hypothetical protein
LTDYPIQKETHSPYLHLFIQRLQYPIDDAALLVEITL